MGVLRVLSRHGDDQIHWDAEAVQVGDPEAAAAVREAERIFSEQRRAGSTAFRVEDGRAVAPILTFDPSVKQIVIVPRVIGG